MECVGICSVLLRAQSKLFPTCVAVVCLQTTDHTTGAHLLTTLAMLHRQTLTQFSHAAVDMQVRDLAGLHTVPGDHTVTQARSDCI